MGAAAAEADRTLFVGNLDPKVTEELIFELFHQVPPGSRPLPARPPALYPGAGRGRHGGAGPGRGTAAAVGQTSEGPRRRRPAGV